MAAKAIQLARKALSAAMTIVPKLTVPQDVKPTIKTFAAQSIPTANLWDIFCPALNVKAKTS